MGLADAARKAWREEREEAYATVMGHSLVEACQDRLKAVVNRWRDYEFVPLRPWEEMVDPYWFASPMWCARSPAEDGDVTEYVFGGEGDDLTMHLVGTCRHCEAKVALNPPVTSTASWWEASEYGVPYRHRCPKATPVVVAPLVTPASATG